MCGLSSSWPLHGVQLRAHGLLLWCLSSSSPDIFLISFSGIQAASKYRQRALSRLVLEPEPKVDHAGIIWFWILFWRVQVKNVSMEKWGLNEDHFRARSPCWPRWNNLILTTFCLSVLPGLCKGEPGNDHGNLHGVRGHSRFDLTDLIDLYRVFF